MPNQMQMHAHSKFYLLTHVQISKNVIEKIDKVAYI
jgi:hypothetical protein